ncbi:cupin domain-containing protein [Variovorax ginsengisoli]|uniref:Cupin domain-containing protein n=1 Tax=Variovorax ginsengisoli TaxID=363844 RepID=A0ABT8SCW7_9BURK|nr:cupin domain-containing protein [Variovorax ginsengisoli]MDN8617576.1 cupin domain-containing protein [Variovorax ginsengisoli]MDO1536746.1 cupin domain-containing protein [Variovorax ginsengisoli]
MHLTRFEQAPAYEAPNHYDMRCLRLQGKEAGPSTQMWMGMSQILPGGHTTLDGSQIEKLYLVLEGRLTVVSELDGHQEEHELGPYDSCRFAPGEKRQLLNRSQRPVLVALVMANAAPG